MIFAGIGHGSCYYHWNEIFAGVTAEQRSSLVGSQPTLSNCMTFRKNRQQLGEETTKLGLLGTLGSN